MKRAGRNECYNGLLSQPDPDVLKSHRSRSRRISMSDLSFRRDWITKPIFRWAQHVLPSLSDTEREAIEAGDVWWDADLFAGNPDWAKLLAFPPATLVGGGAGVPRRSGRRALPHARRLAASTGSCATCRPRSGTSSRRTSSSRMIIPKEYGGLGFSAYAHSEVIRKLSTRSICAAVTAMVPNSLGPGELLLQFGTKAQQDYWLPRLADGERDPCFGLTSPEAGSDAASMIDSGVVCRGTWRGPRGARHQAQLAQALHHARRRSRPCSGLAFKLYDPDHLHRRPRGHRHHGRAGADQSARRRDRPPASARAACRSRTARTGAATCSFRWINVIGGVEQVGKGWKMLMSALAAGRGISLPSLSAAGAAFAAHTTGAYARVREQFHVPIGRFEAIQERLGRMAATAYLLDAARRLDLRGASITATSPRWSPPS